MYFNLNFCFVSSFPITNRVGKVEWSVSWVSLSLAKSYTMHFSVIMFRLKGLIENEWVIRLNGFRFDWSSLSVPLPASFVQLAKVKGVTAPPYPAAYFPICSIIKDNSLSNNLYMFKRQQFKWAHRVWEKEPGLFATDELFVGKTDNLLRSHVDTCYAWEQKTTAKKK